ncbi:MAG: hypothetical protein U0746_17665 [Gemmataceae bacterium]
MMPPGFVPGQPQQQLTPFWEPPAQVAPRPAPRPQPVAPKPVPRAPTPVAAAPKPPAARAQMPEEPRPSVALTLPTPEQLGVPMPLTWTEIRVRLDRLGANGFALDKEPTGYRFACKLPNGRTIEARAATEGEAARQALAQAEGK